MALAFDLDMDRGLSLMNKDQIAGFVERIPQGLAPDDFIETMVHWILAYEREQCALLVEADGRARGGDCGALLARVASKIRARGQE